MIDRLAGLAICLLLYTGADAADKGPVAHWDFDEGKGDVVHDRSGNKNHGNIHGAKWIRCGKGFALKFDGKDDCVDCGHGPSLDIRAAITLEAWACAEQIPERTEAGIVGKHFTSYLLTRFANETCWWYVCSGGNHCRANLSSGSWVHLAATFDGTTMALYADGEMVGTRQSRYRAVNPGGNLFVGCVIADASAADPAYTRTAHFKGMIDDVRIYNRALSDVEIKNHYQRDAATRTTEPVVDFSPVTEGRKLRASGFALIAGKGGAVQINVGEDAYVVESSFSYPGERIGKNLLSETPAGSGRAWQPRVEKNGADVIEIAAAGAHYTLTRKVRLREHRIEIEDTLTNMANVPVGVIVANYVTAAQTFKSPFLSGKAENPMVFVSLDKSRLGILAEDNVSRLQFEPKCSSNRAGFELKHFALDAGERYTLRWALYPLHKEDGYFAFVNRIRRDWNSNFTIEGPAAFVRFSARLGLIDDPAGLRAWLNRRGIKVLVFTDPWLDYHTGQDLTRAEYKQILRRARRKLKAAAPDIKVLGNIESDWLALRPARITGFDQLPVFEAGKPTMLFLTPAQTKIIEDADLPWKDSYKRNADGMLRMEVYRGRAVKGSRVVTGAKYSAVAVYPEVGNYQYKFLIEQMRFLLDEVGLDGVYMDDFSQSWAFSHGKWDGRTVDIDPATGKITRQYTHCGLVGIAARRQLCDYALSRGKIVFANGCAAATEMQSLPLFRFLEIPLRSFNPALLRDGQKPPFLPRLYEAHLATPISLGIGNRDLQRDSVNAARGFTKAIITLLRHGLLYCYYIYEPSFPETGGDYGPVRHMFPVTPVRLFEGGIEGKERTITCVSGAYSWNHERPPTILLFDRVGREKKHNFKPEKTDAGWKVVIKLRDWQEIAVIEE